MTTSPEPVDVPAPAPSGPLVWLRRLAPVAVLIAVFAAIYASGLGEWLSFDRLRENRETLTAWVEANTVLASVSFVLGYALLVAISFPVGTFLTLLGGFLFGPFLGTLWVVLGATLGATILFMVARTALAEPLRARAGNFIRRMEDGFQEGAFSYMLVLRLVPLFPFWVVNLAPAFLGVPLRTFVLATAIGIIPGSFVYTSVGNGLGAVFESGGEPDLGLIFQPQVLLPILGLALLSLVPVAYRKWRGRSA